MNPIHAGRRSHGATGRWRRRWNALAEDHRRWGLWRTLYMRLMERLRPALVLCHVFVRPLGRMVLPDDPPPESRSVSRRARNCWQRARPRSSNCQPGWSRRH